MRPAERAQASRNVLEKTWVGSIGFSAKKVWVQAKEKFKKFDSDFRGRVQEVG
jgi:hypothetical protein